MAGRPGGVNGRLAVDLFAGAGGWDLPGRAVTPRLAGIEIDAAACLTRAAAGLATIRADVAAYPARAPAGPLWGLIASPPCTTFSQAGARAGMALMDILAGLIADLLAGRDTRPARIAEMEAELARSGWAAGKPGRDARIAAAARMAALVAEPARYIAAARPEWVAMEQVREVMPLWGAYAAGLAALGYGTWHGVLCAADYGVPQTRRRAVFISSRTRVPRCPPPTHYDPAGGAQHLFLNAPWVSMVEAIGWGATARPAPTVTAGGTGAGGAEPFGRRSRAMLLRELAAGRWVLRVDRQDKAVTRRLDEPAQTIKSGHSAATELAWVSPDGQREILLEPWEAGVLQGFPPDWDWRGSRTRQLRQIGNAIPPGLARAVMLEASGCGGLAEAA
jgi:DNA (cytosine-5)-methyltransferase 1